jgi:hypothetical protein
MPAKRNTNKLSQLYKTIDQKGLSQDAKETLKKLRLATANFNKKEGKEADAFNLFYNRLLAKKPTAIKTTKEYKEMVLEKKREVARKMMEAKKAKQESRQGQGSERDASRPAKPFGWRLKGKHNYRKPTRADISSGKAYYEGRINRADTKRTKFPMLERGGYMAKGGEVDASYSVWVRKGASDDEEVVKSNLTKAQAKKLMDSLWDKGEYYEIGMSSSLYESGGYMAHGGKVYSSDDAYEVIILKDGVEVDRVLVRARNKGEAREMYEDTYESKMMKKHGEDIAYEIIIAPSKMAHGGEMEKRRTLKFSDAVLYKGNMYTFVKRDGEVGFVSNSQGAWGMGGSFLPLRKMFRSDLEENLTDMYGNKFYIPPYDELIKMPYGFAKGGSMDNGGVFYTESHKLGHE